MSATEVMNQYRGKMRSANVCSCPNGTPTMPVGSVSTQCETNGAVDCSGCTTAGYTLSAAAGTGAQTCVAKVCSCPNGTPTVFDGAGAATLCETDGAVDCSGCTTSGYTLSAVAGTGAQT